MNPLLESLLEEIKKLTPLMIKILNGTAPAMVQKKDPNLQLARPSSDKPALRIHTFFDLVQQALGLVENFIHEIEQKILSTNTLFPQKICLDTEVDDSEMELMQYQQIEESLLQLLHLHRYQRLSLEERDKLVANYISGESNKVLVKTFSHQMAQFETLESIAFRFGISDWREIAEFNDLLPSEMETGQVLMIPIRFSPVEANQEFQNLPVFGSIQGVNTFGKDLSNKLNITAVNNTVGENLLDLEVLDGVSTLSQGLENIVQTVPGEHPAISSFGFDGIANDNIPDALRESWFSLRLEQALAQDPRVATVRIDSIQEQGELMEIEVTVLTKGNTSIRVEGIV